VFVEVKKKARRHRLALSHTASQTDAPGPTLWFPGRRATVLPEVQEAQAAPDAPLPAVRPLRASHGPPLCVAQQLRRPPQLQGFFPFPALCVAGAWLDAHTAGRELTTHDMCADVTTAVLHGLVLLVSRALSSSNASVTVRQQAKLAAREEAGEFALVEAAAASSATQVMAMVISVPLVCALGMLLGWHVYLVLSNKTTVEYHEGVRAKRTAQVVRRGDSRSNSGHIYDLGAYANCQAALGPQARSRKSAYACARADATPCVQPGCWLVPGCSADGDGLTFQTL